VRRLVHLLAANKLLPDGVRNRDLAVEARASGDQLVKPAV